MPDTTVQLNDDNIGLFTLLTPAWTQTWVQFALVLM